MSEIRRQAVAELFGTFILVLFGPMAVTTAILISQTGIGTPGLLLIALAHGLGLAAAVAATGRISGGHVNPAITLAAWAIKKISAKKVPIYIAAQLIGAALAGFIQLGLFGFDAISATNLGVTTPNLTLANPAIVALIAEIVGTAILSFVVFSVTEKESRIPAAPAIGITLAGGIMSLGVISGGSFNPARTFGPSLAVAVQNLSIFNTFWIYLVGPIIGALIGAYVYRLTRK